jgi:hypothetical protein
MDRPWRGDGDGRAALDLVKQPGQVALRLGRPNFAHINLISTSRIDPSKQFCNNGQGRTFR